MLRMRRPLSAMTLIFCVLAVTCVSVVVLARLQPLPDLVDGLAECDNQPCYLSITPGRTSWSEAQSIFIGRPNSHVDDTTVDSRPGAGVQTLLVSYNQREVGHVSILLRGLQRPTIGAWIARYGPPCVMAVFPQQRFVILRYQNLEAFHYFDGPQPDKFVLTPDMLIQAVVLVDMPNFCEIRFPGLSKRWVGFTSTPYAAH